MGFLFVCWHSVCMEHALLLAQLNCLWILDFIFRKSVASHFLHLNSVLWESKEAQRGGSLLPPASSRLLHSRTWRQLAVLAGAVCVQTVTWAVWKGAGRSSFHSFFSKKPGRLAQGCLFQLTFPSLNGALSPYRNITFSYTRSKR